MIRWRDEPPADMPAALREQWVAAWIVRMRREGWSWDALAHYAAEGPPWTPRWSTGRDVRRWLARHPRRCPAADPCPHVTCRRHLWDGERSLQSLSWQHTCAVTEAMRHGGRNGARIAELLGVSRETVAQDLRQALASAREVWDFDVGVDAWVTLWDPGGAGGDTW